MPESPAKPWPTGKKNCNPTPSLSLTSTPGSWLPKPQRRPAAAWLLFLLLFSLAWPTAGRAADEHQQAPWQELLQREFYPSYELARLAVTEARLQETKGRVELHFTLVQQQDTPLPLDIPMLVSTPRQVYSTTLTSQRKKTAFTLELNDRPTEIRLDPYQELPRHLSPNELPPSWAGFLAAEQRLAIIPAETPAAWEPLLDLLARLDIDALPLEQIEPAALATSSLLFVGSEQENPARGFFAAPLHPGSNHPITLEARENPINPEQTGILLSLHSQPAAADLETLLTTLDSPGLFSQLKIADNTLEQQIKAPHQQGILVRLDQPPDGIAAPARRSFHEIMAELADTRVIYVGEVHSRYEDHLLQLRVLRAMHQQHPKVAVAMEMFPAATQPVLDAYVAGELDEPEFLRQSDYFTNWSFDYRLYREIIDFARHHGLPIIALNLERGLTSKVYREGGTTALSPEELAQLPADRDLALPGFQQRIGAAFTMHDSDPETDPAGFSGFLQAQSIWDEQMAHRMAKFLQENPEYRLLAVVGQGHSDKRNAIPPRLARRLAVEQKVILPVREQTASAPAADYFFFVPSQSLPDQALLGVRVRDGEEESGALVVGLSPRGKARAAGIMEGDLIVAIDDWEITGTNELRIAMLYQQPGQTVKVRVLRPIDTERDEETEELEELEELEETPKSFETQEFTLEL